MTLTFVHIALQALGTPPGGGSYPILGFKPNSATYNEGATTQMRMERNPEGINVPTNVRVTERTPTLQIGVQSVNPDFIAAKMARALIVGASTGLYHFDKVIDKNSYPAIAEGFQGHGAVEDDANAVGSVWKDGRFVAMTRSAFENFAPATAGDRFAVGDDAALEFSDSVKGNRAVVLIPFPTTGTLSLGDLQMDFRVRASAVLDEFGQKQVVNLDISRMQVNLQESGGLEDNADSYQMTLVDVSGECAAQLAMHRVKAKC